MFSHQIVCFGEGASPSIGRVDLYDQHKGYTYVQDSSCTFSLVKNEEIFPLEELLPPIEEVVEKWNTLTNEEKLNILDRGMIGEYRITFPDPCMIIHFYRELIILDIRNKAIVVFDDYIENIREIDLEDFVPNFHHTSTLRNIVARIIKLECQ